LIDISQLSTLAVIQILTCKGQDLIVDDGFKNLDLSFTLDHSIDEITSLLFAKAI